MARAKQGPVPGQMIVDTVSYQESQPAGTASYLVFGTGRSGNTRGPTPRPKPCIRTEPVEVTTDVELNVHTRVVSGVASRADGDCG